MVKDELSNTKDHLAEARRKLDFEAIAKDAPKVSTILYKAQTMAPIAPAKPWGKWARTTAAGLAILAVAFAPIFPKTSNLALVKVNFENQFTKPAAQQLIFDVVSGLPPQVLAGADFNVVPGTDGHGEMGQLTLNVCAINANADQLAEEIQDQLAGSESMSQPFFAKVNAAKLSEFKSLPQLIAGLLSRKGKGEEGNLTSSLASSFLSRERLVEAGLSRRLAEEGYTLSAFKFQDEATGEIPEGYDFIIPAWPKWALASVQSYTDRTDHQQQQIRIIVEDYLLSINLGFNDILLTDQPEQWLPLITKVIGKDGETDRLLSDRLQAELALPSGIDGPGVTQEYDKWIAEAMAKVSPHAGYMVNYQPRSAFQPGQHNNLYFATITITGPQKQGYVDLESKLESLTEKTEF